MAHIDSLDTLLSEQLRDLLDAERRLAKAMPKAVKAASNDELQSALKGHLVETEEHIVRLERSLEILGAPTRAKACAGMRGILEEMQEHMNDDYADDGLRDAQIIGSAQRAEHYEIAAYGTAAAHARQLGYEEVADLLEVSLAEERSADETMTRIAESVVNADAASADDEEIETPDRPSSAASHHGKSR
jgi:ferritin-like metal-binding protein YciE